MIDHLTSALCTTLPRGGPPLERPAQHARHRGAAMQHVYVRAWVCRRSCARYRMAARGARHRPMHVATTRTWGDNPCRCVAHAALLSSPPPMSAESVHTEHARQAKRSTKRPAHQMATHHCEWPPPPARGVAHLCCWPGTTALTTIAGFGEGRAGGVRRPRARLPQVQCPPPPPSERHSGRPQETLANLVKNCVFDIRVCNDVNDSDYQEIPAEAMAIVSEEVTAVTTCCEIGTCPCTTCPGTSFDCLTIEQDRPVWLHHLVVSGPIPVEIAAQPAHTGRVHVAHPHGRVVRAVPNDERRRHHVRHAHLDAVPCPLSAARCVFLPAWGRTATDTGCAVFPTTARSKGRPAVSSERRPAVSSQYGAAPA